MSRGRRPDKHFLSIPSWPALHSAPCKPNANKSGMRGSPCSPPSLCGMSCPFPVSSSHRYVDGLPWKHCAKRRIRSPCSILSNPSITALLEIRSCTNSINGHHCCTAVQICDGLQGCAATHSHPAFMVKAHRKREVASSAFLATSSQRYQPSQSHPVTTALLTIRSPVPKLTLLGTTIRNRGQLSNIGWRWSTVIPEGPPVAPLLAVCKQTRNWDSSISKLTDGVDWITSPLSCWRGRGGLLSGFVNSLNVASVPGATCAPSDATLAADRCPRWTRFLARSASQRCVNAFVRTRRGPARHWKNFSPTTATTGRPGTIGIVPPTSSWAPHLLLVVCGASSGQKHEKLPPSGLLTSLR